MNKQNEALKLALVAERVLKAWDDPQGMPALCEEMNALREALAEQPAQQETVRDLSMMRDKSYGYTPSAKAVSSFNAAMNAPQPAPVQQEPKKDLMYSTVAMQERHAAFVDRAVATLEQAKREALAEQPAQQHIEHCLWARNGHTPCPHVQPAQQQEPAGAVYRYGKDSSGKPWHGIRWTASGLDLPDGTLIYTFPQPSKPWVGLTDEEKQTAIWSEGGFGAGALWADAKLREKNA